MASVWHYPIDSEQAWKKGTLVSKTENDPRAMPVILLLEDDEQLRTAMADILRDDGCEVLEYSTPSSVPALETLGRVTAVVTDYRMPITDGITFADRFHALHADVPIVLTTSHATEFLDAQVAARPHMRLLEKPIDYAMLIDLLPK